MKTYTSEDAWDIYQPVFILDTKKPLISYCVQYAQRSFNLSLSFSTDKLFIIFDSNERKIKKFLQELYNSYDSFCDKDKQKNPLYLYGQYEYKQEKIICILDDTHNILTSEAISPMTIARGVILSKKVSLV